MQLGIDSTGQWNPHQFALDMGWDYSCIEATAERGLSETDEAGLTKEQGAMLLDWCKLTVEEERGKMTTVERNEHIERLKESGRKEYDELLANCSKTVGLTDAELQPRVDQERELFGVDSRDAEDIRAQARYLQDRLLCQSREEYAQEYAETKIKNL